MSWQHALIPGCDPEGKPILSVVAKRTYTIAQGSVSLSPGQLDLCTEDTYDDPDNPIYAEVVSENDLIHFKPTTDVVVTGKAHVPSGKKAYHMDLSVRVGPLSKTVRVFGKRRVESKALKGFVISDAEPFIEMPLGYRYAYGGMSLDRSGTLQSYYPNPIGKGFHLKGSFEDASGLAVPHLEDPNSPVLSEHLVLSKFEEWEQCPRPASFNWTRRNFYPRYTFAGVLPEYLEAAMRSREKMAKKYPQLANTSIPKMDYRVYQGASDDLWGKSLAGDEPVTLQYLDPRFPKFEFQLPGDIPLIVIDIGDGPFETRSALQTVAIDKEKNTLAMTWRGCMPYEGVEQLAEIPMLDIQVGSRDPKWEHENQSHSSEIAVNSDPDAVTLHHKLSCYSAARPQRTRR